MSETSGRCVYDGEPLYNVDLKIGDDGRIRLAGPMLFSGYRLRPDLTDAVRDGDWFLTSDLGTLADGRLRVLGRADDVVNTGGEKVVAAAVAAVVAEHPRSPTPSWSAVPTPNGASGWSPSWSPPRPRPWPSSAPSPRSGCPPTPPPPSWSSSPRYRFCPMANRTLRASVMVFDGNHKVLSHVQQTAEAGRRAR